MTRGIKALGACLGLLWILLLLLPLVLLGESLSLEQLQQGLMDPRFAPALWLSLHTSLISLVLTVVLGTPVAWYLARTPPRWSQALDGILSLPIVIPPAVVGVALLVTFGRQGVLGSMLYDLGLELPFSRKGVVLAQLVVSSPLYVQGARTAFARVQETHLEVAQTLGASYIQRLRYVALPMALPGLITAASLAWARALGEFGATLLFAGNRMGHTQTMPLAIFSAMESSVALAVVFSLALAILGLFALGAMRWMAMRNGGKR